MKLIYKYYGFESGLKALKDRTLGFNMPEQFNDPMEGRLWLHQMGVEGSGPDLYLNNVGILCMTEDPLNPLMWSHYGERHTGFVIGYDVNEPILGREKDCLFSFQDGRIFYSPDYETNDASGDASRALHWLALGMDGDRTPQIEETLRHIFLMKQKCWSYEKEIRIIKLLSNFGKQQHEWISITGNNFQTLSTRIAPMTSLSRSSLKLLKVSAGSIKHVILGMHNPLLQEGTDVHSDAELKSDLEAEKVRIDTTKWAADGHSLEAVKANVTNWGHKKLIQTKILDHSELEAISRKQPLAGSEKESLTITKHPNGKVEAFWDSELSGSGGVSVFLSLE